MALLSPTDAAAFRVLRARLGFFEAVRVALAVGVAQARGGPFEDLDPPRDAAEAGSREQAGGAVLLYRTLLRRHGSRARDLTAQVVEASALAFLDGALGDLDLPALDEATDEDRAAFVQERLARFPNVTARLDRADAREVRFTVTRCRLVQLVHDAGHPELAPLFCRGDARWFGEVQPGVRLERPTTIAGGGSACLFVLHREEET